jgi:hypothetical protein
MKLRKELLVVSRKGLVAEEFRATGGIVPTEYFIFSYGIYYRTVYQRFSNIAK